MSPVPAIGTAGPGYAQTINAAIEAQERITVGPTHYNLRARAAGNGVDNDTQAIADTIAEVPAGSKILAPPGKYLTDPHTITKVLAIEGVDRMSTWFVPRANVAGPLINFDLGVPATIYKGYGPSVSGIGMDLYGAALMTGIRMGNNCHFARVRDVFMQGGAVSIQSDGPNGFYEDLALQDATRFFKIGQYGSEITLRDMYLARNVAGTTECAIEMIATTADASGGAIYMVNVRLAPAAGTRIINCGMKISAPASSSFPLFMTGCILDNCNGGPALDLVNVNDIHVANGWFISEWGPAIRITGGGRMLFANNSLFGGTDPARAASFEFLGGGVGSNEGTNEITLVGNKLPTGPAYKLPTVGKPTNLRRNDLVLTPNWTNDPAGLKAAEGMRTVGATGQPGFENGWANYDINNTPARFWRDNVGVVHVDGMVKSGTIPSTVFTLPATYRPDFNRRFPVMTPGGGGFVEVEAEGRVIVQAGSNTWIDLATVAFQAN